MKSSQALFCPSTKVIITSVHKWGTSYDYRAWGEFRALPTMEASRLAVIKQPASIINIIEILGTPGTRLANVLGFYKPQHYVAGSGGPHGEGGNIGFCDGHVKWYNFAGMPTTTWGTDWPEQSISCDVRYNP